jgi:hypothetical protein
LDSQKAVGILEKSLTSSIKLLSHYYFERKAAKGKDRMESKKHSAAEAE